MRSKLGKAVRSRFKKQIGLRLPGFHEVAGAIVPPGWPVYGLAVAPDLTFYIVLALHSMKDSFTVEGAWTRNGRFPSATGLLRPRAFPEANIRQDEARHGDFAFRIANLWQRHDYWWDLVPQKSWEESEKEDESFLEAGIIPPEPSLDEAMSKVDAMVDDAIGRIERYLLPYFDEVAAQSGGGEKVSELARRR